MLARQLVKTLAAKLSREEGVDDDEGGVESDSLEDVLGSRHPPNARQHVTISSSKSGDEASRDTISNQ